MYPVARMLFILAHPSFGVVVLVCETSFISIELLKFADNIITTYFYHLCSRSSQVRMVRLRWPWKTLPCSVQFRVLCVSIHLMLFPARELLSWLQTTKASPSPVRLVQKPPSSTRMMKCSQLERERCVVCWNEYLKGSVETDFTTCLHAQSVGCPPVGHRPGDRCWCWSYHGGSYDCLRKTQRRRYQHPCG